MCKEIYIVVTGPEESVKDFKIRLRSRNVDVDGAGRPCKEKMAKIICCLNHFESTIPVFTSFESLIMSSSSPKEVFDSLGLSQLYHDYVKSMY